MYILHAYLIVNKLIAIIGQKRLYGLFARIVNYVDKFNMNAVIDILYLKWWWNMLDYRVYYYRDF